MHTSASNPVMCFLHASMDVTSDSDSKSFTMSARGMASKASYQLPRKALGGSPLQMFHLVPQYDQISGPFAAAARRERSTIGPVEPVDRPDSFSPT